MPGRIEVKWSQGTAYDLFVSQAVMHQPERFGLRASWAAGVRSRLPAVERSCMEEAQEIFFAPLRWLASLPEPKDSANALLELSLLTASRRLEVLADSPRLTPEIRQVLGEVSQRGAWSDTDAAALRSLLTLGGTTPKPKAVQALLKAWAEPGVFGEQYLAAIQAYYSVFFIEEETRIRPALIAALEQAVDKAGRMALEDLLVDLSQGVHFTSLEYDELTLAPSYWITPFILYDAVSLGKGLLLFGARPPEAALVPGESVPDAMLRALKALADPTRLRILHYLDNQPQTPSQLARLLRLRAPTVIHHLNALRLAGLVHLTLDVGGERRYAIRAETVAATFAALQSFLGQAGR